MPKIRPRAFCPPSGCSICSNWAEMACGSTRVSKRERKSPLYDPMIAKVIAHGPTRDAARGRLAQALGDSAVWPLKTNAGFLVKALTQPDFVAARIDTGLIAREGDALMPSAHPTVEALADGATALGRGGDLAGFRLNAPMRRRASFLLNGEAITIDYDPRNGAAVAREDVLIAEDGQVWRLSPFRAGGTGGADASDGAILSPMPGRIIAVAVGDGEAVTKGQKLLTLEAMKMEHSLVAPFDGRIAQLSAAEGRQVSEGALLVKIEKEEHG